jgi:glutamine synthetase
MADRHAVFKQFLKELADQMGMFMAKDQSGTGPDLTGRPLK